LQLNGSASSKLEAAPRKKAQKEMKPEPAIESEPKEDSENMFMDDEAARANWFEVRT